jgi:hypothetical protein
MKLNLGPAKGKDFATVIGPWLVTPDELEEYKISTPKGNIYKLSMKAFHNGKQVSQGNTKDITYSFAEILERVSYGVEIQPGEVIGSGNEINGLTMGGVGFGTKIDHIDVYCNADDGYEWFGGTVNTKYLTSIFNNDDSFDVDEGFTGLGQFWFALMNADTVNGDKGGEHDGETGAGNDATFSTSFSIPKTYMVVYNATYIGNPNKSTEAFRLRDNWGGEYHNSIFYGFGGSDAVELESDGEGRFLGGEIIFSGNTFFDLNKGITAASYGKSASGGGTETAIDFIFNATFATTTANFLKDPAFRSLDRRDTTADGSGLSNVGVNPTPTDAQARANTGAGGAFGVPVTSTFFDASPTYKGAFDPATSVALWTTGWTALNARGVLVDRADGLSID